MGELLDKHQAAARLDVRPDTLIHGASQTRAKPEADRDRWDWPLPATYEMRPSGNAMGPRQIRTPLWDADDLDAYKAAGRRPPAVARARDETGKFAGTAQ